MTKEEKQKAYKRKWYIENKEKTIARSAAWQKANPEKAKASKKAWNQDNLDYFKKYRETWYTDNPDYNRAYYEANKEKCAANTKAWCKENKGAVNALKAKRRAAQLDRTPLWANMDAIRELYEEAIALTESTGEAHHVDHVIPLQGKLVSGLHVEGNLQVLTATENCRKSNRFSIEEFNSK